MKFIIPLLLSLTCTANAAWQGEWGAWEKANSGAAVQITDCTVASCKFQFASEAGSKISCHGSGKLAIKSAVEARGSFLASLKAKSCALALNLTPENKLKAVLEGGDCLRLCTSEKAKTLPAELTLVNESPFQAALPWPKCQTDTREAAKILCTDEKLSDDFLKASDLQSQAKILEGKFYVEKSKRIAELEDPFKACTTADTARECLEVQVAKNLATAQEALTRIRHLRNEFDAELKTSAKNPAVVEELKGSYTRKFKSGTTSGDKFDVTDDVKLSKDETDLNFDVLLNFFDEQECTLSGTAKQTLGRRFVFRDSGKGKGGDKNCKLILFKEAEDLVLVDDPPNSCKSHCGKGGSFFGARFPLSSRK